MTYTFSWRTTSLLLASLLLGCENTKTTEPEVETTTKVVRLQFDRTLFAFEKIAVQLTTNSGTEGTYQVVYTSDIPPSAILDLQTEVPAGQNFEAKVNIIYSSGNFSATNFEQFTFTADNLVEVSLPLAAKVLYCGSATESSTSLGCAYLGIPDSVGIWKSPQAQDLGIVGTWTKSGDMMNSFTITIDSLGRYTYINQGQIAITPSTTGFLSLEDATHVRYWPVAGSSSEVLLTTALTSNKWTIERDTNGKVTSLGGAKASQ